MSDFTTPFGNNAEKRQPTTDEKNNGFQCGPASQLLFNQLFFQLQAEMNSIHTAGGVLGTPDSVNTTLLNIQALIEAATGSGETENYVLISQASTRLPIFPEFLTDDGKINVSAPATGTVRLPGGIDFLHRGLVVKSTVETDFTTEASKTYHIRWSPMDGYLMKDLSNVTYNPDVKPETHTMFDTTYDDMLISRVITNSSNVANITNLVNKNRIVISGSEYSPKGNYSTFQSDVNATDSLSITDGFDEAFVNLSRKPEACMNYFNNMIENGGAINFNVGVEALSRYSLKVWAQGDSNMTVGWKVFA